MVAGLSLPFRHSRILYFSEDGTLETMTLPVYDTEAKTQLSQALQATAYTLSSCSV